MISNYIDDPTLQLALQVLLAVLFAMGVVWLASVKRVTLTKESVIAMTRGFVQVVLVGSILVLLFTGPLWIGLPVLLIMIGVAGWTAANRIRNVPGALLVAVQSILLGAGLTILLMTLVGALEPQLDVLIPVGSMLIASSMNACAQSLERMLSEVEAHRGQIEAALALGADTSVTIEPYAQAAVQASMIPSLNSLRTLGIVWIPGLMAGMILAGSNPIYASVYQFVVLVLLFACAALTSLVSTQLIRRQLFTKAEQLVLHTQRN